MAHFIVQKKQEKLKWQSFGNFNDYKIDKNVCRKLAQLIKKAPKQDVKITLLWQLA